MMQCDPAATLFEVHAIESMPGYTNVRMCICCRKRSGQTYSRKLEKAIEGSVQRAAAIADSSVCLPTAESEVATVPSASDPSQRHSVFAPGTADATCTCQHFLRGNVCKHIMKVSY